MTFWFRPGAPRCGAPGCDHRLRILVTLTTVMEPMVEPPFLGVDRAARMRHGQRRSRLSRLEAPGRPST